MKLSQAQLVTDVEKLVAKNKVQYVSLRVCDVPGRWLHFTVPADRIFPNGKMSKEFLKDGLAFDGSSFEGFKSIEQSDTLAMPDLRSAVIDPVAKKPTLSLACTVSEPETMNSYWRDPRAVALRAEEYLIDTKVADTAYFGPEVEFFIFDEVSWKMNNGMNYLNIVSREGGVGEYDDDGTVSRVRTQEGYFVMPPYDCYFDLREEMVQELQKAGIEVERDTHERATAGSAEIDIKYDSLVSIADKVLLFKYIIKNVAHKYGKVVTFMPKPLFGHNGSGMHTHNSLWKNGEPVFYDPNGSYHQLSKTAMHYIGGILKHAKALSALTTPTVNSYKRLVPGFEAPTTIAFGYRNRSTCIRIPGHPATPNSRRIELRIPDPSANPYLCFSAMLMAGLDGIKHEIDPIKSGYGPLEVSGYNMQGLNGQDVNFTPSSLEEALNALENDNKFLQEGNVFSSEFVDLWIEYKRDEIAKVSKYPTPADFDQYFDC